MTMLIRTAPFDSQNHRPYHAEHRPTSYHPTYPTPEMEQKGLLTARPAGSCIRPPRIRPCARITTPRTPLCTYRNKHPTRRFGIWRFGKGNPRSVYGTTISCQTHWPKRLAIPTARSIGRASQRSLIFRSSSPSPEATEDRITEAISFRRISW